MEPGTSDILAPSWRSEDRFRLTDCVRSKGESMLVHAMELRDQGVVPMICTGSLQAAKAKATQQMNRRVFTSKQPPEDIILDHYGLIYRRNLVRGGDNPQWGPWV